MTFQFNRLLQGFFLCLSAIFLINTKALALDKSTSSALSHYIMGVMYEDLGDIDAAIKEYESALRIDREASIIHLNLASSLIKKNNIPRAIAELNSAINLDPEAIEPHAILAIIYSSQNQADAARGEYEIALKNASKLQPKNADIYKSLGIIYLQQKKFKQALDTYRLIIDLTPNDAEAHFYLANIYNELNDNQAAEKEARRALELRPDYPEALNFLGYLYTQENRNLDEAGEMIKKALAFQPDNGAYVDSLGWFYFRKGNFKEALKELKRASTLIEDPEIYDHLGDVYLKMNDSVNAKLNWEKSLKLDPNQQKVREKCNTLMPKSKN